MKKIIVSIIICIITFGIIFLNISNEEENNKENKNISIILETEEGNIETNAFPSKEDYVYDKLVCKNMENTVETTFDKDTWKLNLSVEEERIDGDFQCNIYLLEKKEYDFDYTGDPQTFTAPATGTYQIELWGASSISTYDFSGKGAYTSGKISLSKNEKIYLYVGGEGLNANETAMGGYNGGGNTSKNTNGASGYTGAGATDVRLTSGAWNNTKSLRSRIMVAGGGAFSMKGDVYGNLSFGHAGGLVGEDGNYYFNSDGTSNLPYVGKGGNQTAGGIAPTKHPVAVTNGTAGNFGIGGTGGQSSNGASVGGGAGGGGGYYGGSGASGLYNGTFSGGGGSSYISGHTGCVAITSASSTTPKSGCTTGTTNNSCSIHYSGKVFTDTIMIDGSGYKWTNTKGSLTLMPNPSGGYYESGKGHAGNGYARIRLVS